MSVKGSRCEAAFFLFFFKNLLTFKKNALYLQCISKLIQYAIK